MRPSRLIPAVLALALVAVACSSGGDGGPDVAVDGDLLPSERLELPSFGFGEFQALMEQLRGTPVVVNIWASWCGPCRAEAPHLSAAARTYEGRVQFLGVDILDNRGSAREFILEFDWPYPSVFDSDGEIRDRLGFFGQPVTIFYDAAGTEVSSWQGPIGAEELDERIRQILA